MPVTRSQQKWWFFFTLWEGLVSWYLGEQEPFIWGPNTQLQLWREAQLKKVWSQKPGFELQLPNHSRDQRSSWIKMIHCRGHWERIGRHRAPGWERGSRSQRWTRWEASGCLERDRCALTLHHSLFKRQKWTEQISLSLGGEVLEAKRQGCCSLWLVPGPLPSAPAEPGSLGHSCPIHGL